MFVLCNLTASRENTNGNLTQRELLKAVDNPKMIFPKRNLHHLFAYAHTHGWLARTPASKFMVMKVYWKIIIGNIGVGGVNKIDTLAPDDKRKTKD